MQQKQKELVLVLVKSLISKKVWVWLEQVISVHPTEKEVVKHMVKK
jgi:hypothetical protein